jgi:uracil-DNA glycosylase family 4
MPRNPQCTLCSLCEGVQSVNIWGVGAYNGLFLVGEAPGRTEDAKGAPSVGAAGRLLDRTLGEAGLSRSDLYITNVAKCRPPDNRNPVDTELEACEHYLVEEIKRATPRVIVALGAVALKRLTGEKSISKSRGKVFRLDSRFNYPCDVVATFHPAHALRYPKFEPTLVQDLVYAVSTLNPKTDEQVTFVTTPDQFVAFNVRLRRAIEEQTWAAIDLETPGQRDPYAEGAEIVLIGFAFDEDHAFVLPWDMGKHVDVSRIPFVGQNIKFELQWLWQHGINLTPVMDTMLMSHYLDERLPSNLDDISKRMFAAPPYGQDIDYENEPLPSYARYCGLDCIYTLRAARQWKEYVDNPTYRLTLATHVAVAHMESHGIGFSPERNAVLDRELHQAVQRATAGLPLLGTTNLNSPVQAASYLVQHGVPLSELTPTGRLSVSKDALLPHRNHPVAKVYREWKDTNESRKKFTTKWPGFVRGDGRIHASYYPLTETGRHSCSRPNIQQVPRDGRFRANFIASSESELVSWDASQVELRMAACVAPENHMRELYREGADIHIETARQMVPREPTKEDRQRAKPVNFGFLYGMGINKFIRQSLKDYEIEFTPDQAESARDRYFGLFPQLQEWHQETIAELHRAHKLVSVFGRTRHLEEVASSNWEIRSHAHRQGINFLVQSPSADITHAALVVSRDWPIKVVGTVHDSIMFEQSEGTGDLYAARLMPEAIRYLEQLFGWKPPIPFEADWKIGDCWL